MVFLWFSHENLHFQDCDQPSTSWPKRLSTMDSSSRLPADLSHHALALQVALGHGPGFSGDRVIPELKGEVSYGFNVVQYGFDMVS